MDEWSFPCSCLDTKWPNLHDIFGVRSVTGVGWEDSCGSKVSLGDPHVLETPTVPQGLKTRMQQHSALNLCALTFRRCCSGGAAGQTEGHPLQHQQHCWDSIIALWHWPRSPTPLALTSIPFPSLEAGGRQDLSFPCLVTKTPPTASLCDVGNSLAAKNTGAIRPNKHRQPAKLPLIQQLQARKACSLSVNLKTKKIKREKKHKRLFLKCSVNKKKGKVDRMLPTLH